MHEEKELPIFEQLDVLRTFLTSKLELSKYGTGVEFVGVILVLEPQERDFHSSYLDYSKPHKELTIQYRLPYEQMLEATPDENFHILVNSFLAALETYHLADASVLNEQSDNIEDFDFTAWKIDVEQWFEAEGWLAKETN